MKLQPILYVTDMDAATAWYSQLLRTDPTVRGSHWTSFDVAGGYLALHQTDQLDSGGPVELSLVCDGALEDVVERVGFTGPIIDEAFGRSIRLVDPTGIAVQVNEHSEL